MSKTILYCAATVLALTGCASEEKHQQIADTSRAQTLVDQADQAGAQQFAAADLEAARSKLKVAQNKKTDDEVAQRMAQESAADAEVAMARTRAGKAQQAGTQVNAGHESLQNEANGQPQQAPPPPAPPIAAEPPAQEPPH